MNNERINPKVINLSREPLSKDEIRLLEKGLKFTPTPRSTPDKLKCDVIEFCRKLRLAEEFYKDEDEDELQEEEVRPLVKNKSRYQGRKGRNNTLDTYITFLENFPTEQVQRQITNLKPSEQRGLGKLMNRKDIIIKEADNGGAVVIMDKDYYKGKIEQLLLDTSQYKDVEENRDKKVSEKISQFAEKYKDHLDKSEYKYLVNHPWRSSNFYGLPKVHKSKQISEAVETSNKSYIHLEHPQDLTFRPIVGGPECPTQRLSNLLDKILKPLCKNVKSNIRDTFDFLNKLKREVPEECVILTLDVSNLYGSIPHDLGIKAIEYWVKEYPNDICGNFPKEFIIDGLKLVLENNIMTFDNKYYLQINGTAMGTKMAPTYATLIMGFLELKLYQKIEQEYNHEIRVYVEEN